MSTLSAIGLALLSYLVTGYEFRESDLRIRILRLLYVRLPYETIAICDMHTARRRYSILSQSFEETIRRVLLRKSNGFAVALRVGDFEAFVSKLRDHAPHVQVRKLKEIERSFALRRRTP